MNICTYVVPVSLKPKLYIISLDRESQTYKNFEYNKKWTLQILSKDCKRFVRPLWKASGKDKDKLTSITKYLTEKNTVPILKDIVASLELRYIQTLSQDAWDHELYLVEITSYRYHHPHKEILTTDDIYSW